MKRFLQVVAVVLVCFSTARGFYIVNNYRSLNVNAGISMVRLMYEYDKIGDVYERADLLRRRCSSEVWEEIQPENDAHWDGTWERTKNAPTRVHIIASYPGMIIYALENEFVYPAYLWSFEYKLEHGVFTEVREYQLVGMRESKDGGFF